MRYLLPSVQAKARDMCFNQTVSTMDVASGLFTKISLSEQVPSVLQAPLLQKLTD